MNGKTQTISTCFVNLYIMFLVLRYHNMNIVKWMNVVSSVKKLIQFIILKHFISYHCITAEHDTNNCIIFSIFIENYNNIIYWGWPFSTL